MATGYYSRISNTDVNGTVLISTLSGRNVRDLEFAQAVANHDPVTLVTTDTSLSVAMLVQAAADRLLINPSGITGASGVSIALLLGPDAVSQAGAYVRLFNFTSTNQTRVLKFVSTAATPANAFVKLFNNSGTIGGTYVKVVESGVGSGLFKQVAASGANAGVERQVLVQGTTLTSGSEVVTFTILQAINGINCLSATP